MPRHSRKQSLVIAVAAGLAVVAPQVFADPPAGDNYRLMFADDFNGNSLDTNKWSAAYPGWTMPNSASTASANMVAVSNGELTLAAARNGTGSTFTSGSISSYEKFTLTGGYVEARIDLPTTPGSWPAFWGLYTGWPPEIDIMEYPLDTAAGTGYANNQYHTAYHYTNSSGTNTAGAGQVTVSGTNLGTTGYHTFGVKWTPGTSGGVVFYYDGAQKTSWSGSDMADMVYMYMILDYAVGGWPGTPSTTEWPAGWTDQTKVDWVRVWQTNAGGDVTTNWNINGGGAFATSGNWSAGVPNFGNEVAYFGRVGTSSAANVTMGNWQVFGGITFDGLSAGTLAGTTAYTLGSSANKIQLHSTTGGTVVQATSTSTAAHAINANVEIISNTTFRNDMTGGQALTFGGGVTGNGQLTIEGEGPVILSSAGTYRGGTVIDGGAAGPAVLRAGASSALGVGSVVIGSNGNATTARLEIFNNARLSNNIDLRGRNNSSAGIQNNSGSNVLHGTISANVGGGTFLIQSDSGTLTLTGTAAGATARGVALQAGATGSRVFTLQGSGNGVVSGIIRDGSGTVSIIKDGSGIWTFSGANTYTGSTTISAGTLRLATPAVVTPATPVASFSFANVSGTTVINGGSGGAAMNGVLNTNGGTGSINTGGGPASGMGALVLNGNGTTVDVSSSVVNLSSSYNWTVSAWVRTTQPGFTILNKGDGTNWASGYSTFYLGDGSDAGIGAVPDAVRYAGGWLAGSTPVNDGAWHLITYTNAAGAKSIYVDGVLETLSQVQFNNTDTGSMVRIGFSPINEADGNLAPVGSLSGINLYSTALSAAQVAAMYSNTFAGTGSPLPTSSAVTIAAGGTLDVNGITQQIASLNGPTGSAVALGAGQLIVSSASGTSTFSGVISGTGGSLVKSGASTLTLNGANTYTGATTVMGGTLVVNNAADDVLLTGAGGANILSGGRLIFDYSAGSAPDVRTALQSGYAGNWLSGQIRSTTATSLIGLGYRDIGASQILVKPAYYGDADLDGAVSSLDFTAFAAGYGSGASWALGDFNYDDTVNTEDFNYLAGNFGATLPAPSLGDAGLGSMIPEPATLGLLVIPVCFTRRRRSSSC